jgi:hypothetical protein
LLNNDYTYHRTNNIELLEASPSETALSQEKSQNPQHTMRQIEVMPHTESVEFIERGSVMVRVMDKHNFYEAEQMPEDILKDSSIGLLTKIWISISKSLK